MFVESSRHYTAPPEILSPLREWLEAANEKCRKLAAAAASEAQETHEACGRLQRRLAMLADQRRAVAIAPELRCLYEISLSTGCSPEVVAVEDKVCGGCGAEVAGSPPDSGLQSCSACRRVLYWRRTD